MGRKRNRDLQAHGKPVCFHGGIASSQPRWIQLQWAAEKLTRLGVQLHRFTKIPLPNWISSFILPLVDFLECSAVVSN
jgi:hypothetical protein